MVVTGSGKTFAMANIIERLQIPTLILSHNKTLARQLWQEMSELFPENAVEYFVSYYDYYQPEAYLPGRDMYIDKELQMNERIEQERFSTVASLVSRPDVLDLSSDTKPTLALPSHFGIMKPLIKRPSPTIVIIG